MANMRYLEAKKGYKHKDHKDVTLKFIEYAIPCNANGICVEFYADDERTLYLLKVANNDGTYNKQKISDNSERFFTNADELNEFIDRDVCDDYSSLVSLIKRLGE